MIPEEFKKKFIPIKDDVDRIISVRIEEMWDVLKIPNENKMNSDKNSEQLIQVEMI